MSNTIDQKDNLRFGKHIATLSLAIMGGMSISIGGCMFLAIDNKLIGSLFFTLGLFTICTRGFNLFTGKAGYLLDNPPSYVLYLAVIWIGNLLGAWLTAFLMGFTRNAAAFTEKAAAICSTKLNDGAFSVFILAIFCNLLMYIAVDGFKKNSHEFGKYIGLFLCVAGFILAGFEHCVANMFYFAMGGVWSAHTIIRLLIMTAGNVVGALIIPVFEKLAKKEVV